jgi:crotonobetainyl-CoA:carnitine CoA-transferase CaiB-like acyl-CoA transferase
VYPTQDNRWVVIGANADTVFARLAAVVGHAEWSQAGSAYSTHTGRGAAQGELDAAIAAWTLTTDEEPLLKLLDEAGVPAGRIYTAADIAIDPHYRARDMVVQVPQPTLGGEPVAQQGVVPKLDRTPGEIRRGAPLLGEHDAEIWTPLLGVEQLHELRATGVIQ